jgi:Cof subfamily protein (haloacid dehalogenase superfamily)
VADPRDHLEIGNLLKAIDTERGAKVSGARFYFLTGIGAQLELALVNLAMAKADAIGFTPVIAPALVKPETMQGTGFLGAHAAEVYKLADDDLYLVGTSEVALAGYHSGEILDAADLPLRYAGFSSCFRREAGSHGKDTKGIIRVHWFDKVEMFSYVPVDEAEAEHQRLLAWEREFMDSLELAYRVIDVAAGDLGSSAARKFDIEAWFPSQQAYRELTSTSNCTTFQARRLNIRTRGESGTQPVATLNGTLCAIARTIACLLDHHQQPDGTVTVPASSERVRLLATDLDGTLLKSDNSVSDATRDALAAAESAGLIVAFVTGRPPRWLHEVAEATGHRGIAVGANGAVTYDLHTEQVINEHPLTVEVLSSVAAVLRDKIPDVRFAMEYGLDFAFEPGYRHDWEILPLADRQGRLMPQATQSDLETLLSRPAVKLLAKGRGLDPDAFMDEVEALVGTDVTVTRSGHSALVEISAIGITKASGLAALAQSRGVTRSQVAAVGDMPNDVPMLEWAGRSFAVANAHPSARAAAHHVLHRSNDEDAVADLIHSFLDELPGS